MTPLAPPSGRDRTRPMLAVIAPRTRLALAGGAITGGLLAIAVLSGRLAHGDDPFAQPIGLLVTLAILAGGGLLLLPGAIARNGADRVPLWALLAVGLALRLVFLPTVPILDDDTNRYLLDGAVVAAGHNPYAVTPELLIDPDDAPPHLRDLALAGEATIGEIAYPGLRTVYPGMAQLAFGAVAALAPWSLTAWRLCLLAMELATVLLLVGLLRDLGRSPAWALLYWWNPLIVVMLANGAHMDALLGPPLLLALRAALRDHPTPAALWLTVAAGVKLWPVLLAPVLFRRWLAKPLHLVPGALLAGGLALALALPVLAAGVDRSSGFVAYAAVWSNSAPVFHTLWQGLAALARAIGIDDLLALFAARGAVALAAVTLALALALRPVRNDEDLIRRLLAVAAAVFLLSPTAFPWYGVWFLPFLVLARPGLAQMALLSLSATLPLYWLRYRFDDAGQAGLFDGGVAWLIVAPCFAMLALAWVRHARRSRVAEGAGA